MPPRSAIEAALAFRDASPGVITAEGAPRERASGETSPNCYDRRASWLSDTGRALLALLLIPIASPAGAPGPARHGRSRLPAVDPALLQRPALSAGRTVARRARDDRDRRSSQPQTFYMGVASGGLFRTTDGGASWTPITDGKIPLGSMGSIAVADSDPNIIYVGTGSDGVRSNVSTGRGVYQNESTAARPGSSSGFTTPDRSAPSASIRPIRTSSGSRRTGDAFKTNAERGVFKTTDGGQDLEEGAVRQRRRRRDGRRAAAGQPERRLCLDVAARAQAVDDHQRLARRRLLQEHRRRRALHEDHRPACRPS